MKLAVDFQSAQGQKTGIGVSALNLLNALEAQNPHWQFLKYAPARAQDLRVPERIWWESVEIPRRVRADKPDLVYSPGFSPAFLSPVKTVVTVHDLIGMIYPQNLPLPSRFYWSRWLPACIRRADTVVASSESTRRDLERLIGVSAKKVEVVPLGVSPHYFAVPDPLFMQEARRRHELPAEYFLTVSTLEPRKNFLGLLRAFHLFHRTHPSVHLLVAGKQGGQEGKIRALIHELGLDGVVRLLGYVSDADLKALYWGAVGYAFVSFYEGFGFPVLEAMACGKSGVCSSSSSLPEVAGDTAVYVDPDHPGAIAEGIKHFYENTSGRDRLARSALERARTFTWEKTAQRMTAIFKSVVK